MIQDNPDMNQLAFLYYKYLYKFRGAKLSRLSTYAHLRYPKSIYRFIFLILLDMLARTSKSWSERTPTYKGKN